MWYNLAVSKGSMYGIAAGAIAAGAILLANKNGKGKNANVTSISGGVDATIESPSRAMRALGIPQEYWPNMSMGVPFAAGNGNPVWPIETNHEKKYTLSYKTLYGGQIGQKARTFSALRSGGRLHAGVDLYGEEGDIIVAMEDGEVVNHYHFYHGTYALFVQCKSGLVINYSEVKNNSWREFGLGIGSFVRKGQPIARVGKMSGGSQMCHFETYYGSTINNQRLYASNSKSILNPTYYLLLAKTLSESGRTYSSADCLAQVNNNIAVPKEFVAYKLEDIEENEAPQDSVLTDLLSPNTSGKKDRADGP